MLIRTKIVLACFSSVMVAASAMLVVLKVQQRQLSQEIVAEENRVARAES